MEGYRASMRFCEHFFSSFHLYIVRMFASSVYILFEGLHPGSEHLLVLFAFETLLLLKFMSGILKRILSITPPPPPTPCGDVNIYMYTL